MPPAVCRHLREPLLLLLGLTWLNNSVSVGPGDRFDVVFAANMRVTATLPPDVRRELVL